MNGDYRIKMKEICICGINGYNTVLQFKIVLIQNDCIQLFHHAFCNLDEMVSFCDGFFHRCTRYYNYKKLLLEIFKKNAEADLKQ